MHKVKQSVLVGASLLAVGAGGIGVASAATTQSGDTSLAQKIASKFGLKESDVQSVIDADRQEHRADMGQRRTAALEQAVTDGKLTQAQADHIKAAWAEIDKLRDAAGSPNKATDAQRSAIKAKMDELKTWLDQQKIDLRGIIGPRGHMGDHDMPAQPDASSTTSD